MERGVEGVEKTNPPLGEGIGATVKKEENSYTKITQGRKRIFTNERKEGIFCSEGKKKKSLFHYWRKEAATGGGWKKSPSMDTAGVSVTRGNKIKRRELVKMGESGGRKSSMEKNFPNIPKKGKPQECRGCSCKGKAQA